MILSSRRAWLRAWLLSLIAGLALVSLAHVAYGQTPAPVPVQPSLFQLLAALGLHIPLWLQVLAICIPSLVTICSALANVVPPTTKAWKVLHWCALNGPGIQKAVAGTAQSPLAPAGSTDKVIPLPGPGGTAVMLLLCGSLLAGTARADSVVTVGPVAVPQVTTTASQGAPQATPAPSSSSSKVAFTHGPSIPVLSIGWQKVTGADGKVTTQTTTGILKSGAGYLFNWGFFPNKSGTHLLTVGVPVFLKLDQQAGVSGLTFTMSTGAMVGVLDGLLSLGFTYDLFSNVGAPGAAGLFIGKPDLVCAHWIVAFTVPLAGLNSILGTSQ